MEFVDYSRGGKYTLFTTKDEIRKFLERHGEIYLESATTVGAGVTARRDGVSPPFLATWEEDIEGIDEVVPYIWANRDRIYGVMGNGLLLDRLYPPRRRTNKRHTRRKK